MSGSHSQSIKVVRGIRVLGSQSIFGSVSLNLLTSSPTVDADENNIFCFIEVIGDLSLPVRDVFQ